MSKKSIHRTYGLELEKPVSNQKTGEPYGVSERFFDRLKKAANKRKTYATRHVSDIDPTRTLGIISKDLGEQGVDNGFNLLESALPIHTDLTALAETAALDLATVQNALNKENATIINMSNHPLGQTNKQAYQQHGAPKSLYHYITYRGWDHAAGIDAKAQNSPATGVSASEAADAVSIMIGSGAAVIGIFANSPISEGKLTGDKESRLRIWDRMMAKAKVAGDLFTTQYPSQRFYTLAQYFNWMHGETTGIHFVIDGKNEDGYKSLADKTILINGNPSVLDFLAMEEAQATYFRNVSKGKTNKSITIKPSIKHMEAMQFAQFVGARVRYSLQDENFPLDAFLQALSKPDTFAVEKLFEKYAHYIYIEGRDAGSNFPDHELQSLGENLARSVIIAPSAFQAGLIANLQEAVALLDKYGWSQLGTLREAAIKDGLQGEVDGITVERVARDFFEVAAKGLRSHEQWMLAYPEYVLRTSKNGADRAIEFLQNGMSMVDLIRVREVA